MSAIEAAATEGGLPVAALCDALVAPRSTLYRRRAPKAEPKTRPTPPRALPPEERAAVLDALHTEAFVDKAPAEVVATLLDEGRYLCSTRTMYRILGENGEVKERRNQLSHPTYAKPELLATRPNELWSWDITKLRGPVKWTYFYLYVILDVYSRYVVGWMVAHRETGELAKRLIEETCKKHNIEPGDLTVHADRGTSMKSKPVALLLSDLGITKTHSRPYTSNDNPFSESQFKTMKYRPEFPDRFGCIADARAFCVPFFHWNNCEHRHVGIAMLTPADVHFGRAAEALRSRQAVLQKAYELHPERFPHGAPRVPELPREVWINKPEPISTEENPTTRLSEEVTQ